MSLQFVQLNIESNFHLDRLEDILKGSPDVLCLQEIFLKNLEDLAAQYHYNYVFAPCVILNSPEGKFAPLGEWGVAIMTKHKIVGQSEDYYYQSRAEVPSVVNPPQAFPRPLITASINVEGTPYTFATTHFTWAMPVDADVRQKPDLLRMLPLLAKHPSLVLSGDFNAPRGGLVQTTLAGIYSYYIPDSVDTTIDNNLHRAAPLYLVIDHLFATSDYKVEHVSVQTGYSDHCAIFAEVTRVTT
jgi:endonuclease/exonuclease/phosphatase family metal-dependent hydrolase